MEKGIKRSRTSNFSLSERQLLFSLAHKYKGIIENKKTDAVTNEEKQQAWLKIESEFNSSCPDTRQRNVISLKKLYNNKKKDLRKVVAEDRKAMYLTGGGPAIPVVKGEDELLLSIMNEKSVYGLVNPFDSDYLENKENSQPSTSKALAMNVSWTQNDEEPMSRPETQVSAPATSGAKDTLGECSMKTQNWGDMRASMLSTPLSDPLRKATVNSGRRRPATVVRPLTSSAIAERYEQLLEKRLAIADFEKKLLEQKLHQDRELYLLDLEIKKETLRKLKEN